eukprot:CAMPEP_0180661736 /NCGR_PEP_ID=MMETSP1037_2-20121125/59005_1 /TAXON_ID=632150 /ORGANISM="Azadinium spinosum, Strain 3D9" /LENGTH=75 /DNA_ID=CAMNT_0022689327 /DNA_START=91 /DNA_END=318 /DNA_ORIENTATION=+
MVPPRLQRTRPMKQLRLPQDIFRVVQPVPKAVDVPSPRQRHHLVVEKQQQRRLRASQPEATLPPSVHCDPLCDEA